MTLGTFSGGGLGMGVAFSLYDNFSQTATEIQRSMGKLELYTEALQTKISRGFNQMAVGAGMLAASFAVLAPIGYGVKVAAEFEKAKVGLETFLKSKKAADDAFNNIKEDSTKTPFNLMPLLQVNRGLISTGESAKAARIDTMNLANAVAAAGGGNEQLERLAWNMQHIRAQGHASMINLRQFAMNGIPIYTMLESVMGKHLQTGKKIKITYDEIAKALQNYANTTPALDRMSKTLIGRWTTLKDYFLLAMGALGEAVFPILHPLLELLIKLTKGFMEFVQTPLGKWLVITSVAGAVLVGVLGLVMLMSGLASFAVYKLAGAFGAETEASILATVASEGTAAGLWEVAVAALAATWEIALIVAGVALFIYALYKMHTWLVDTDGKMRGFAIAMMVMMGPIGWLVGGISLIVQGLHDFDDALDGNGRKLSGISLFFERVGGIIRGLTEVWNSWNDSTKTFWLSENMEKNLQKLGIRDFVLNLATWLVRLKEFFYGVKEALVSWWGTMKSVASALMDGLNNINEAFGGILFSVDKNTTALEKWREVGKIVGYAIAIMLTELAIIAGFLAVVMLIVGVAMLVAFAIPLGLIWLVYEAVKWLIKGVEWLTDKFGDMGAAGEKAGKGVLDSMKSTGTKIWETAKSWGSSIVDGILAGLKGTWTHLKTWFGSSFPALMPTFAGVGLGLEGKGPGQGWKQVEDINSKGRTYSGQTAPVHAPVNHGLNIIANNVANGQQHNPYVPAPVIPQKQAGSVIHNHIYIDSTEVAKSVIDVLNVEAHRR